jgi:phosphoglycolate phosphatase-like HAD superfamily hydrolase
MKPRVSVIVTDLDNTLYDWLGFWHGCFSAMLNELALKSEIAADVLEKDFRQIHQKHGTSEYAFSIEELRSLREKHGPDANLTEIYKSAIEAYRKARREILRPYPEVVDTLEILKDKGCLLIAHTESMAFYTNDRLRRLGLDRVIDYLYSPPDHEIPNRLSVDKLRHYPKEHYQLRRTIQRETPRGEFKPNPALLRDILKGVGASADQTVYIGDGLMKDVAMAQQAGVLDVWAKYGASQSRQEYELLRRVSHWSEVDVQREKALLKGITITPTCVCETSFKELLDHVEPIKFNGGTGEHLKLVIDVWKKTVDVQQHFNDLELRIRNYALTLLTGVLGLAAFALKEKVPLDVLGLHTSLTSAILVAGTVGWVAFYLMDRQWYHRLLLGAVRHGQEIEEKYRRELPELGLTGAIGRASPTRLKWFTLHSSEKMDLFYIFVAGCLLAMAVGFHFTAPTRGAANETGDAATNSVQAARGIPLPTTNIQPASVSNSPPLPRGL